MERLALLFSIGHGRKIFSCGSMLNLSLEITTKSILLFALWNRINSFFLHRALSRQRSPPVVRFIFVNHYWPLLVHVTHWEGFNISYPCLKVVCNVGKTACTSCLSVIASSNNDSKHVIRFSMVRFHYINNSCSWG
jgi:hypothetical protein